MNEHEFYQTLEEVLEDYGSKRMRVLVRGRDITNEDLHLERGKVQAVEEVLGLLRSTFGYDPHNL